MGAGEFELIARCFADKARAKSDTMLLGIGDDASLHALPRGLHWAVSTDSSVQGVHWPNDMPLSAAADRAVCAALSDLAAMGAHARCAWLNVVAASPDELAGMAEGATVALNRYRVALAGGDTVQAPMNMLAVTVAGTVPAERAMCRHGARVGELLWLCGRVGFAALGLQCWQQGERDAALLSPFVEVRPLLTEGERLSALGVRCCIDVSDGLVQDARHLALASGVSLEIELSRLPDWARLRRLAGADAVRFALAGGEDYALLFTAPASRSDLEAFATPIGRCVSPVAGQPVRVREHGRLLPLPDGYEHFA